MIDKWGAFCYFINIKYSLHQAILEGVATTCSDTETIIENGKVSGMRAQDVQKILNLKHSWEFILDKDTKSIIEFTKDKCWRKMHKY